MTKHALSSDPLYLKRAFSDLGLSEIQGKRHEPRVLELFKKSGHPEISNDETAWCAAAMGGWLKEGGLPNSGSLMARSYVRYGKACDIRKPIPRGAICVWPRGAPPSGHVNICLSDDGTHLTCIGGNQGNGKGGGVTISREPRINLIAARVPVSATNKVKPPVNDEPKRILPEDGSQSQPKSMATSKIGNAQIATVAVAAVPTAATIAKPFLETTTETIAAVSEVATQTGAIVETTKIVTTAVPDSIWVKIVSALASPEFMACAVLVVITVAGLTWYWRRQHRRAGV